jgi:hypothetical protein
MSDVPRGLKKWYEEAIKEGKRANVRSGFVYILFDRTGLSNDQVKGLSKEDVLRRTRYIGQSKDKSGPRPLKHFAEAID